MIQGIVQLKKQIDYWVKKFLLKKTLLILIDLAISYQTLN